MTIGQKFITTYFAIAYWLPGIGNFFFSDKIVSIYKIYPLNQQAFSVLFGVYFLFLAMSSLKVPFYPFSFSVYQKTLTYMGKKYLKLRFFIALIAIYIALYNQDAGWILNTYRYSRVGISDRNSWVLLFVIILNTIIIADLFYSMFVRNYHRNPLTFKRYVENIFLSSALLVLADGTSSAFLALLAMTYSFFPKIFKKVFFVNKNETFFQRIKKFIFSFLLIFLVFMIAWQYGESIKSIKANSQPVVTGEPITRVISAESERANNPFFPTIVLYAKRIFNKVEAIFNDQFNKNHFYYFIERLSVYYYSFLMTTKTTHDILKHQTFSPIFFPLNSLIFRINYLTGGWISVQRPTITSISQLNYQLLTKESLDLRQGSSPGLLGSFNYIFTYPFNVVFCVLYLCFLSALVNCLLSQGRSEVLSMTGIFLVYGYWQVFFESPFDMLIIFDNTVIYVLIMLCIYLKRNNLSTNLPIVNKPEIMDYQMSLLPEEN